MIKPKPRMYSDDNVYIIKDRKLFYLRIIIQNVTECCFDLEFRRDIDNNLSIAFDARVCGTYSAQNVRDYINIVNKILDLIEVLNSKHIIVEECGEDEKTKIFPYEINFSKNVQKWSKRANIFHDEHWGYKLSNEFLNEWCTKETKQ